MSLSRKIGVHIIGNPGIPLGRPAVAKWIDPSPAQLAAARAETGADCLFAVRFFHENEPVDKPERRADEWVDAHQAQMLALRDASGPNCLFEFYNEPGDDEEQHQMSNHCRAEVRRVQRMHALGLRSGVCSFAMGRPDEHMWGIYDPLFAILLPTDAYCEHNYWRDLADIVNPYHVARWTLPDIVPHLPSWLPICVTEAGRDLVFDIQPHGYAGWRADPSLTEDGYMDELRGFGALLDTMPQVVGATIFTAGGHGWENYDVARIWPRVVAEYPGAVTPPVVVPPVDPVPYYHSDRNATIQYVILHDTEDRGFDSLGRNTEVWFRNNPGSVSAHAIIASNGAVIRCVPDELAAHHAGLGAVAALPGINPNRVSLGLELDYPEKPASPAWPEAQLASAAVVVKAWCEAYNIPRANVLTHRQVDPTRRTDPRNFDYEGFLNRVFMPAVEVLQPAIIAYNPDAALYRAALAMNAGAIAVSPETDFDGRRYQCFRFPGDHTNQHWFSCIIGDWGNVKHEVRAE